MKEYLHDYYIEPEKMIVSSDQTKPRRDWPLMIWTNMALRRRTFWKCKNKITLQTLERTILSLSKIDGYYFEVQ